MPPSNGKSQKREAKASLIRSIVSRRIMSLRQKPDAKADTKVAATLRMTPPVHPKLGTREARRVAAISRMTPKGHRKPTTKVVVTDHIPYLNAAVRRLSRRRHI